MPDPGLEERPKMKLLHEASVRTKRVLISDLARINDGIRGHVTRPGQESGQ